MSLNSHDAWSLIVKTSGPWQLTLFQRLHTQQSLSSDVIFLKQKKPPHGWKAWRAGPACQVAHRQTAFLTFSCSSAHQIYRHDLFCYFSLSKHAFGITNSREFRQRIVIFCQVAQKIWATMSLRPSQMPSRFRLFLPFSSEFDRNTWEDIPFGGSRLFSVNTQIHK